MATNISSPNNSFVNFNVDQYGQSCVPDLTVCLPVSAISDVNFQVIATGDAGDLNNLETSNGGIGYVVAVCKTCEANALDVCNYIARLTFKMGNSEIERIGFIEEFSGSDAFNDLNDEECFYLCLYKVTWDLGDEMPSLCGATPGLTITYISCSNCFIKQEDTCKTSLIKYRSNEDSMGFRYGGNNLANVYNIIRLPMYLKQPQYSSTRNVYRKSDGTLVKLSAIMTEVWIADTDYLTKDIHKKLAIALEHDSVHIVSEDSDFDGFVMFEDSYDINYQDFLDYPTARAKFKLKTTPLDLTNSNCS